MTVKELHNRLTELYPKTLSCSWDNDGIMISRDTDAEVKKVLVALDAAAEVVKYAAANGFDTVLTHHPMLFRGPKSVTPEVLTGRKILDAAIAGVSVISLHTRLDAGADGVNDQLCRTVGFEPTGCFGDDDAPTLGRVAEIAPMTADELAALVKDKLGCDAVRVTGDMTRVVTKVGFCGGDGKDFVIPALIEGCDAYITGDAGYNMAQDASEDGLVVIEVGHYHSEAPVCARLAALAEEIAGAKAEIYDSCGYKIL
ncbi:MAG: Nif3-like dinuclear metal center hexameric protein [Ruminococcaceae bacterium]|nr:Nif3-like dinuclear metal center hexameric protein [Oscillospiraceae bacterium]